MDFIKQNLLIVVLATLGIVFLGIGVVQMISVQNKSSDIEFQAGEESSKNSESDVKGVSTQKLMVDVAGAVNKPGVYSLSSDSRIQDAITAAGGFSADANTDAIAKSINLAQKVIDGTKIYIPKQGEQVQAFSSQAGSSASSQNSQININSASNSELESLPAIGPVTANKIVAGRPYGKIEDLVEKKVVGSSTFEKIKDKIRVY